MENPIFYEGVIALSSVIIGIILSQGWEWIKKKRDEKENQEAAKTLISLEIEQNEKHLNNYWTSVSNSNPEWYNENGDFYFSQLAYAINDVPFPEFSNEGWRSQLNNIGKIYDKESLEDVWRKYRSFQRLREIKEHLFVLENESERKGRQAAIRSGGSPVSGLVKGLTFNENAPSLAKKFKSITEELIGKKAVKFENKEV